MKVLALLACCCSVVACGSDGGSSDQDTTATCPLVGERYDAYASADGARCGEGDGAGSCRAGDRCIEAGICEFVSSAPGEAYCAMLDRRYDPFSGAEGIRCGAGDGAGHCLEGDRCAEPSVCEAVLSAAGGKPHAELLDAEYSAYYGAEGVRCGEGEGSGYCIAGDRCVRPDVCASVLSAMGGVLDGARLGARYDPYSEADGVRCGEGEGAGSCIGGDLCHEADETCEVVLSARTF